VADGGVAHGFMLEQALDDLHCHLAVQAVHGLGRGVAEHAEDALGVVGNGLTCLVDVEDDLPATQHYPDHQCRQQDNT